ncbi:hypothetical protein CVT91_01990 [Candidatus Atribacteria bacterium HGW-Atribacteria-1]|nr:MAG: hypothetical protein CVT91_01990 [Candidatus Atribacteria bacterium HGW-Atribacteria-1]
MGVELYLQKLSGEFNLIITVKFIYKWTNRRIQKKNYTFEEFWCFLKYNPLPEPKIYHQLYTLYPY